MKDNKPEFPLTISFHEDGYVWTLDNEEEVATNLEWFDSSASDENVSVTDNQGRPVMLLVEKLEVKQCILK